MRRFGEWRHGVALAGLLLLAAGDTPGDYGGVRRAWADARATARADPARALPSFDALVAEAPGNNGLLLSAISAARKAGDKARVARWVAAYVAQGGGFARSDVDTFVAELGSLADHAVLAKGLANAAPLGQASVAAEVPSALHLIEGVAWDPARRAVLVSSVIDRTVVRIGARGVPVELLRLAPETGSPMALAFDARRALLWAAADGAPFEGGAGSGGLARVGADGNPVLLTAPGVATLHLGDLTLGPDGSVYAGDSRNGAIYRCPPGCLQLDILVPPGKLRSAQGMAVSPDGDRLWVSDYGYGLLAVTLPGGETARVRPGLGMALDGIDGMVLRRGRLIAVQNGAAPARLIEIALDRAGTAATGLRVLARGGAAAEDPTQVALAPGGSLLMVANAQWPLYMRGPEAGREGQAVTRIVRFGAVRAVPSRGTR